MAGGWVDVEQFFIRTTQIGPNGELPETWRENYNQGPEGIDITLPQNDQIPANLMLGDVIQYDWDKNGTWDHAAIVVDFENGIPYVASHTNDHYMVPYILQPNTNYRFIHIVRSNGYPPVKAEITQGSDDAGSFHATCAFSSNANEVYFGVWQRLHAATCHRHGL